MKDPREQIAKLSPFNITLVAILGSFHRDEITWQEADSQILKLVKDAGYRKLAEDQSFPEDYEEFIKDFRRVEL